MESWFFRMCSALTGGQEEIVDVRELLRHAQQSRVQVRIQPRAAGPGGPVSLTTTVEQVLEDAIVISQPMKGGLVHPLVRYEQCRLIVPGRRRPWAGWTKMLGRIRFDSGGRAPLYGYRMSMPDELEETERRQQPRATRPPSDLPEAELLKAGRSGAIHGRVRDISPMGASLICRNAPASLRCGDHVHLKVDLPDPAGLIREKVSVVDVFRDSGSGAQIVRVRFRSKIDAIAAAMRKLHSVGGDRRRSA